MSLIRSAAAVLWRQRNGGEVCLARRVERMRFFGGVFAFAGGCVEDVDAEVGGGTPGGDLLSAAIREIIEELGIDLRSGGRASAGLRRALLEDPARWVGEWGDGDLAGFAPPALRLVTPDFYPRRFDTHFFVFEVDDGLELDLLAAELDDGGWDTPAGWLRRWHDGDLLLASPTVIMLRALAGTGPAGWVRALGQLQESVEDPGHLQELRLEPAIRLLPLRTPTLPPARHTNAYLVGSAGCWLVDPATPFGAEQDVLLRSLREADVELAGILLTHHHPDHVGAAVRVAREFGAPVLAHARTRERLPEIVVHRDIVDGEEIRFLHADGSEGTLRALHTPGHAPGHLCFLETRYGGLLAGDMVSTLSSILVDPDEDGDMGEYLASLERLVGIAPSIVYPAHGPADSRGARALSEQLEHRRGRTAAVLEALAEGPLELDALTRAVWGDVPRPMLSFARKSARAILLDEVRRGRVEFDGERARLH